MEIDKMDQKTAYEKIKLTEVNSHLTCHLCKGYYIDATTIVECLHSFCRSCIIQYLQLNSYCPVCEVMINTAKPNIKPDKTLQDIVYKLVPGLYASEMSRRRQFYKDYPQQAAMVSPEARGACTERIIFSPQDAISLSIEYTTDDQPEWYRNRPVTEVPLRRYLQCPAMLRVEHLKKFICNKYNVDSVAFHVDILYKRVPLPDHYTLMDIAYIYSWKRNEPMKFFFRITDINLVSERFDYFEPSLMNAEEQEEIRHHTSRTPAKSKHAIKKETVKTEPKETPKIKTEIEIKPKSEVSDKISVKKECVDKKANNVIKREVDENVENMQVNQNSELSDCKVKTEASCSPKSQEIDENIQTNNQKVPKNNFENCFLDIKPLANSPPNLITSGANCTQELTIKTNSFSNIIGYNPKTNATLTNLQKKCFVPTLLKAVPTPKTQKSQKSKEVSPKKSPKPTKTSPSLQKTIENISKRVDNLPQTVEHIPKSFENIFKTSETPKKSSKSVESFSKTLKSIHETIKNFPRCDTPPSMVESRLKTVESSSKSTENLLKFIEPPKVGENRLKMTKTILKTLENASKTATSSEPIDKPLKIEESGEGNIEVDGEKAQFLNSIQLTAKNTLPVVPKIVINAADKPQGAKRKYIRKEKPAKKIKLSPSKPKMLIPKNVKIVAKNNVCNEAVRQMITNVKQQVNNVSKIVVQADSKEPQTNQLKCLFDSCKINIPSSLSITLTESPRSDDGYESKPAPIKPVQNYIEILKLPDTISPTNTENDNTDCKTDSKEKDKQKEQNNIKKSQLTFQTMFEEAIKRNERMKDQLYQIQNQSKGGDKKLPVILKSPVKLKKNQSNALDLSKSSPKPEVPHKRNILEIAHQLSKKSRLEAESPKSPLLPVAEIKKEPDLEESKQINIINNNFSSGGSISIQNNSMSCLNKIPIPRLPVAKAPTLKLGPSNARAVAKPVPKLPIKLPKTPKVIEAPTLTMSPNQILEKYNITSLQQLNANLNQAQMAFQQALMMSHQMELQRLQANQKHWLANPNVLAHYENYVQSLKNQNQVCGNTNKN